MNYKTVLALILFAFSLNSYSQSLSLKLGYNANDRILIINNDDAGMCHSSNIGTFEGFEKGVITSSTVMVPCPWFSEIVEYAKANPNRDFGIHLALTSEWKYYRWTGIAPKESVKGLYDPNGYLWGSVEDVYKHATPQEALIEGRAQIQRALDAGIKVTHIDSHMGTYQLNPDYMKIYFQLASEFNLPLRMASQKTMEKFGFENMRKEYAEKGLVFTDYFIYDELQNYKEVKSFWTDIIKNLKPGVTELYIHASKMSDELKYITYSSKTRAEEAELFTYDKEFKELLEKENIKLISYRPLLNLQRKTIQPN